MTQAIAKIDPKARQLQMIEVVNDPRVRKLANEMRLMSPVFQAIGNDGNPKFSDADMIGLAAAQMMTGLSVQAGELYCIPKIGVQVATKVIVASAIQAAYERGDRIHIAYTDVFEGMPEWDSEWAKGSTVRAIIVKSPKAQVDWYEERTAYTRELRAAGYERDEIMPKVDERYGRSPKPMICFGVVGPEEKRDFNGKAIPDNPKFTWKDKADKRATKKFVNKHGYAMPISLLEKLRGVDQVNTAIGYADEQPIAIVRQPSAPSAEPEPVSWKDEITALAHRGQALMTKDTPIEIATNLSAAIAAGRAVYARNGDASQEEIAEAKKQLTDAITEAEAQQQHAAAAEAVIEP